MKTEMIVFLTPNFNLFKSDFQRNKPVFTKVFISKTLVNVPHKSIAGEFNFVLELIKLGF